MVLNFTLLIIGFVVLIKGADYLVNGASSLARGFKISNLVIGLTVVAFGTSTPELTVNLFSSVRGMNDAIYGNIIGSNLFNLLFILGIAGLIYPLSVQRTTVRYEIPFSLFCALILYFLVNDEIFFGSPENSLSRMEALVLLLLFGLFMFYILKTAKLEQDVESDKTGAKTLSTWLSVVYVVSGIVALVLGGKLVTDSAVYIARAFSMSEKLIGLTVLAAGTSLPELATSAMAAYRRNTDIAIGNVVGSNIFNIIFILGINGTVRPVPYNATMNADMFVLMLGTVALLLAMFTFKRNKLDRVEAGVFLAAYVLYSVYLFWRN
ncbi:MAG: calcium/sodium antiporter [Imperialibacter sp.]|uniref:calcium/sodium antiporter n=1 Tax=Imperialibacter sp. TaxID=2038411 RepID=UPI0032EF5B9A